MYKFKLTMNGVLNRKNYRPNKKTDTYVCYKIPVLSN